MAKRHLSLKDLASELNISISTVFRALKNHPDISPELTRKVQELAAIRNNTPNPLAMGLLKQETRMIGVVAFADEFHATLLTPQLTSIMHPTREIGIKAAELFFKKMEDPAFAETVFLQTTLVVRESSARK